jgi:outer membrane protein assembly factor BamB
MKRFPKVLLSASLAILMLGACSGRKYFEPENTHSANFAVQDTGKEAVSIMRDGITFADGSFLTKKGIGAFKLLEGYHYVTQSDRYLLAADDKGNIAVYDRKSGKLLQKNSLKMPLISAGIRGDRIFYIQQDNIFGIYSISAKKTIIEAKVGRAFAIDTRIANPMPLGNLVIVPTLDGKLLIVDPSNPRAARGLAIGKEYNLNNIIYLSKIGRFIIAATPRKLISVAPGAMHKYSAPVADVTISGNTIYLLTVGGEIVKLSPTLKVLAKRKFQYAQFTTIAVVGGKIYALDRSGALVVLDPTLKRSKIYDIGSVENYAFVSGGKLYKDKEVIELSKLSYE